MPRRRIVVAIALSTAAIATWVAVLRDRTPPSRNTVASIEVAPAPTPAPAPEPDTGILNTLDGSIHDLGFGVEITVPAYFKAEKIPHEPHAVTFGDDSRRIRAVANAVPASKSPRHDDPLEGARALAKDQKTRITHFETDANGSYVIFDGMLEHVPMRQYLVSKKSPKGRVSIWIILLADGITNRDNLALVDEMRTGGRLVAR